MSNDKWVSVPVSPKGYKPITVYVPKNPGVYSAKITISENSEQVEWLDESQQQGVDEGVLKQAIADFVFEVGKFGKFKHQPYSAILLEVGLWVSENQWLQNKLKSQPSGSEPTAGKFDYIKNSKLFKDTKLPSQPVVQHQQDELWNDVYFMIDDWGQKSGSVLKQKLMNKYLLIKKDK